jgi:predicted HD phosphohydrolase
VALRRWDDEAKVVDLEVPDLDSYRNMAQEVLAGGR